MAKRKTNSFNPEKFVPIGQAAKILNVSIDTLRRWDQDGTLHSIRPDGKTRFFDIAELKKISGPKGNGKKAPPQPQRIQENINQNDEIRELTNIIEGDKKDKAIHRYLAQEIRKAYDRIDQLTRFRNFVVSCFITVSVTALTITGFLTYSFIRYPKETALFFGHRIDVPSSLIKGKNVLSQATGANKKQLSFFANMLKPISNVSLGIVKQIAPETHAQIMKTEPIEDVNDIFTRDEQGNIIPTVALRLQDSSGIFITDKEQIKNLNAEYVQHRKPGTDEGDLVVFDTGNVVSALRIGRVNLLLGSVSGGIGGAVADGSLTAEDLASGSIITVKLADDAVTGAKVADDAITLGTLTTGDYVAKFTAGGGLTGNASGEGSAPTLAVGAGNGITVNEDAITIDATTTSTTTTTSANSGLEVTSGGLRLLGGCSSNQILKWNSSSEVWSCSTDSSGSASDDSLDFAQLEDTLDLDAATEVNLGSYALTVNVDSSSNFIVNLTSTGDFTIQDAGTTFFTFSDAGALTQAGSGQVTFTGNVDATSGLDITGALTVSTTSDFQGNISNSTGNVVLADVVDIGSATTGINITTAGIISDTDGNVVIGDTVDLGSSTTGLNVTTAGAISDSDGNISLNDSTDVTGNLDISGTLTSGTSDAFQISTTGDITTTGGDITGANSAAIDLGEATTGTITFTPGTTGDFVFSVDSDSNIQASPTITGTSAIDVFTMTITNQTSSGTQRGIVLTNADDSANAVTDALITLDNAETSASTVTDAIVITSSGVNNGITDAIDVSATNINNAVNLGANFALFDGIRIFEGTTGTITIEDTSGNDLITVTDTGTAGNLNVTGIYKSNGTSGITATCSSTQTLNDIDVSGGIVTAGTCTTNAADLAEHYKADEPLEPGDVVVASSTSGQSQGSPDFEPSVKKSTVSYDPKVLGVYSTKPWKVLGEPSENSVPIALVGRVPVKIAKTSKSIQTGDFLTTSGVKGRAMKAEQTGPTIGKALENWNSSSNQDTIMVFVNPSYANPKGLLAELQIGITKEGKLASPDLDQEEASSSALSNPETIKQILGRLEKLESKEASEESKQQEGTDSALLDLQSKLEVLQGEVLSASTSAILDSAENLLDHENSTVLSSLIVTGKTNVVDLGVTGNLSAGLIFLDGLNATIDSLGVPLRLQSNRTADVQFVGDLFVVDKEGNIHLKEGRIIANDNVRGISVKVEEGKTELKVTFPKARPTPAYAVNITPSWITEVAVSDKKEDGFTVKFGNSAPANSTFDWIVLD